MLASSSPTPGQLIQPHHSAPLLWKGPYVFTADNRLFQPQQLHDQVVSVGLETRASPRKLLYVHKWNFCQEMDK